jgi:hypothetical protein
MWAYCVIAAMYTVRDRVHRNIHLSEKLKWRYYGKTTKA